MRRKTQIVTAVVAAVFSAGLVFAQPTPPDAPPPAADQAPVPATVKGTVIGMNLNGDGQPNGLLLKTADGQPPAQVNFPPHMADAIGKAVKAGTVVTAETRPVPPKPPAPRGGPKGGPKEGPGGPGGPKDGPDGPGPGPDGPNPGGPKDGPKGPKDDRPAPPPADHPVSELVTLTPDGGEAIRVLRPDEMPTVTAKGKVVRLNYAREGQVDGAVLDDGTFVHVGPREAGTLGLAVGQTLDVEGTKPAKAGDAKVVHATKVNGTALDRPTPPRP